MGITTEQYRARIGGFSQPDKSPKYPKLDKLDIMAIARTSRLVAQVLLILLVIGGVERNPGPPKQTRQATLSASGELLDWKKELDELRNEFKALRQENNSLKRRVDFLESLNKRNNLFIYGLVEETDENVEEKICSEIAEKLGVEVSRDDMDYSRRVGKKAAARKEGEDGEEGEAVEKESGPRPIVCRFTKTKVRDSVLSMARSLAASKTTRAKLGTLKFNEDFTQIVRNTRRKLIPFLKQFREANIQDKNFKCFLRHDKLVVNGIVFELNEKRKNW